MRNLINNIWTIGQYEIQTNKTQTRPKKSGAGVNQSQITFDLLTLKEILTIFVAIFIHHAVLFIKKKKICNNFKIL